MLYTQCIMVFLLHENEFGWSKVGRVHFETYTLVKLTLLCFVVLTLKYRYVQKRNSTSKSTLQHHFRETRSQVPNANMALCIASIQFYWLKINQNDVYYDHKYFTIKLAEILAGILVSVVLAFTGFDHPQPHPSPQNRQSSYGPENVVHFFLTQCLTYIML